MILVVVPSASADGASRSVASRAGRMIRRIGAATLAAASGGADGPQHALRPGRGGVGGPHPAPACPPPRAPFWVTTRARPRAGQRVPFAGRDHEPRALVLHQPARGGPD